MNTLTNLRWFNIEGKKDSRSDKPSKCSSPDRAGDVCQAYVSRHVACYCTESSSDGVYEFMCVSEQPQCFLLPDEKERRMPRRSPRCRGGHFDFSEEVVSRAHLTAPRWFFFKHLSLKYCLHLCSFSVWPWLSLFFGIFLSSLSCFSPVLLFWNNCISGPLQCDIKTFPKNNQMFC